MVKNIKLIIILLLFSTSAYAAPRPPAPTALTPDTSDICNTSFLASWTTTTTPDSFILRVTESETPVPGFDNINVGTSTSYLVDGLTANTEYAFTVRAKVGNKISKNSNKITVTTTPEPSLFSAFALVFLLFFRHQK